MKTHSTRNSFWKSFVYLFGIYLLIIPSIFAILDWHLFKRYFQKDAGLFSFALIAAAATISIALSLWSRHDRKLHRW